MKIFISTMFVWFVCWGFAIVFSQGYPTGAGISPAFKLKEVYLVDSNGKEVDILTEPCRVWIEDFNTAVVVRGRTIKVRIARQLYGNRYADIYNLWTREKDGQGYVHIVVEVRNTFISVSVDEADGKPPGCSLEQANNEERHLASPKGDHEKLFPVILSFQKGETFVIGSGVWNGLYVWTAPHVASAVGQMDVWGWKDKRWQLIARDVQFVCGRDYCSAKLDVPNNFYWFWTTKEKGELLMLIAAPGEEPFIIKAPRESVEGFFIFDKKKLPHIHSGASGSPLAVYNGMAWNIFGFLSGVGFVNLPDGNAHFFVYFSTVKDGERR